jgi:hypothetical protein
MPGEAPTGAAGGGLRLGARPDDVLIVPRRSPARCRRDVSTAARFTRRIEVSARSLNPAMSWAPA